MESGHACERSHRGGRSRAFARSRGGGAAPRHAGEGWSRYGIGAFIDEEGGLTTVAVALALLVSLTLVFALLQVQWLNGRSADTQAVADATAMAGCQVVRAYSTVAQVIDACVVTIGMAGMFAEGAGLVLECIPPTIPVGMECTRAGDQIFDARREFSTSAARGLEGFEKAIPALIYADSFMTAHANSADGIDYWGVAFPFPEESGTDFGLDEGADEEADELSDTNDEMAEKTEENQEFADGMDDALERGWRADCGSTASARSMHERAESLAGLTGSMNQRVGDYENWNFGMALTRARNYYQKRLERERSERTSLSYTYEIADSYVRESYYEYAEDLLQRGTYSAQGDSIDMDLPELANSVEELKRTDLYSRRAWPCTREGTRTVIHAWSGCRGATGPAAGTATLRDLEEGRVKRCAECDLSIGQVAKAATGALNNDAGFEHYWQIVVDASRDWAENRRKFDESKGEMEDIGDEGIDLFDAAMRKFEAPRPKLQPPGAWGCISVVGHGEVENDRIVRAFTGEAELPFGVAIAGATLAPDTSTYENNLLSHFWDSIEPGDGGLFEPILQMVFSLWGDLLMAYQGASEGFGAAFNGIFDFLDNPITGWLSEPIRNSLLDIIDNLHLEPADLRLKKPVLCHTQDILDKDGNSTTAKILHYLQVIPSDGDFDDILEAVGQKALYEGLDEEITIAEFRLDILGFNLFTIPFTINIAEMLGLEDPEAAT